MAAYFATGLGSGFTGGQLDYREIRHKLDMEELDRQMKQQQEGFNQEIQKREQQRLEDQFNLEKTKAQYEMMHPYDKILAPLVFGAANLGQSGMDLSGILNGTKNLGSEVGRAMSPQPVPGPVSALPGLTGTTMNPDMRTAGGISAGPAMGTAPLLSQAQPTSQQEPPTGATTPGWVPQNKDDLAWEKFRLSALAARYKSGHEVLMDEAAGKLPHEDVVQLLQMLPPGETATPIPSGKLGEKTQADIDLEKAHIELDKAHTQVAKQQALVIPKAEAFRESTKRIDQSLRSASLGLEQSRLNLSLTRQGHMTGQEYWKQQHQIDAEIGKDDTVIRNAKDRVAALKISMQVALMKPGTKNNPEYYGSHEIPDPVKNVRKQYSGLIDYYSDQITEYESKKQQLKEEQQSIPKAGGNSLQPANPLKGEGGVSVVAAPKFKAPIARDVEEAFLNGVPEAKIIELGKKEYPGVNIASVLANVKKAHRK